MKLKLTVHVFFQFFCTVRNVGQLPEWMPAGLLPLVNAACKDYLALNGVILLCYVCYVCTDVNITSARRVH